MESLQGQEQDLSKEGLTEEISRRTGEDVGEGKERVSTYQEGLFPEPPSLYSAKPPKALSLAL
jgi:hypothetical protein